jgi:putative flippase GtrA
MSRASRLSLQAVRDHMKLVPQMARFAVVGVINTAVDLAVLNTLIAISHRGRSGLLYSLFKAISFLVAVLNSYRLNSRWTFRYSAAENTPMGVGRFISVSVLGLAINVGIASSVASFAGPVLWLAMWWPSVAALAGAACGLGFNFAGYKYLVFYLGRSEPLGLCSETQHRVTTGRTLARGRGASAPPNETRQSPPRVRSS